MHISSLIINNYKSFYASALIQFTTGFNIIIGQNNVGKTALIEALSLHFSDIPHRSQLTLPMRDTPLNSKSIVQVTFHLAEEEVYNLLIDRLGKFIIPRLVADDSRGQPVELDRIDSILNMMLRPSAQITCEISGNGSLISAILAGIEANTNKSITQPALSILADRASRELRLERKVAVGPTDLFHFQLAKLLQERVYFFNAERLNVSRHPFGVREVLLPDASNLPEVLFHLQGNIARYQKFNDLVSKIFPEVRLISVTSEKRTSNLEIRVWNIDPQEERDDLAMPLSESGTGIGQVLAILYVVLTAEQPRTIIIDEPQSFLHPGAIRKLFEILKTHYAQHQYVITTHSPIALSATDPATMLLVRKQGHESTVEEIDVGEANQLQLTLTELGARLADYYGADKILWVEGATEEACFPHIIRGLLRQSLLGTLILGVLATGDLEGRQAERIFAIYQRLSRGPSLLPRDVGFLFDLEGRSDRARQDLEREGKGRVRFIERRMYENYLLHPGAIAATINAQDTEREYTVTEQEVKTWLGAQVWSNKFLDRKEPKLAKADKTEELWLRKLHGGDLLTECFNYFTQARLPYGKVAHGLALTKWIVNHDPKWLEEIANLLRSLLGPGNYQRDIAVR